MLGGRDASSKNCLWPRAPEVVHPAASVEGMQKVGTRRHAHIQQNPTYFAMLDDLLMPLRSRKPWDDVSPPTSLLPARGFDDAGVWGGRVLKHRNLLKASSLTRLCWRCCMCSVLSFVPAITAYYRDSLLPQLHVLSSASVLLTIKKPLNSPFFALVWALRGSA